HGSNLRHAHDFAHGADLHSVRFFADAESYELAVFLHATLRVRDDPLRLTRTRAIHGRTSSFARHFLRGVAASGSCGRSQSGPCCPAGCARASAFAPLRRKVPWNWKPIAAPAPASCPWRERRPAPRKPAL